MSSTVNLYPDLVHEGDLTPDFEDEIEVICNDIHAACEGWGTDESSLLTAMGSTTAEDRYKIVIKFEEIYEKPLIDLIRSETSGDFGMVLKLLALSPAEAEARLIDKATKDWGTAEGHLYPLVCGRSNADMDALKKTFYKMFEKDLVSLVDSEVDGDLEKLLVVCLQGIEEEFDPDYHTEEKVEEDTEVFYDAGQGTFFGTDEKGMFNILTLSPPEHLANINAAYADKYGYTLFKAFELELGGIAEKAALFTLGMKLKPYETVAKLIKSACAGWGTDESLLAACIVRYQNILPDVQLAHVELFEKTIHERIRDECGGKFEDVLLEIINKVCPEE